MRLGPDVQTQSCVARFFDPGSYPAPGVAAGEAPVIRLDFAAASPDNDCNETHRHSPAGQEARLRGIAVANGETETISDDITTRTIAVIAEYSGLKPEEITRETQLDETGISSLELTEIVMDLEEMFDIQIDLNAAEAWDALKNVGNILDEIDKLAGTKG